MTDTKLLWDKEELELGQTKATCLSPGAECPIQGLKGFYNLLRLQLPWFVMSSEDSRGRRGVLDPNIVREKAKIRCPHTRVHGIEAIQLYDLVGETEVRSPNAWTLFQMIHPTTLLEQ